MEPTPIQTAGTNTATTATTPQAPSPAPATTTSPQSLADRIAEYQKTPGVFEDSPQVPKEAPTPAPTPTSPEEALERALKDETFPTDIKSDGAKANWKALRERAKAAKELEAKLKTISDEYEAFKKTPRTGADPAELDSIKKERDTLSERLKEVELERHPQFEGYFKQKTETVLSQVKEIGGAEHGDKIANLLKLPDSPWKKAQMEDIFAKLSPVDQAELGAALLEYKKINSEKSLELNKAKANYEKIVARQQEQTKAAQQEQKSKLDEAIERHLTEAQKSIPLFQKKDGDDKWNKQVDQVLGTIRNAFTGVPTMDDLATAAIHAKSFPVVLENNLALSKENDALRKELESLKSAKPKPGSGSAPDAGPAIPANMSLSDRIVWQAQQSGAVR